MIRAYVFLFFSAVMMLVGTTHAQAEGFDFHELMGGGPNFRTQRSSPIPRQLVYLESNYAPGTVVIDTAERRLFLVLPRGQALRYCNGGGRYGLRCGVLDRLSDQEEWASRTTEAQMLCLGTNP